MSCPHCAAGLPNIAGMHFNATKENGVQHLGPCPDQPPAPRVELLADEEPPKPRTLSEMTNRIRAFGPKGSGKAFAERSVPREPGEDDDEGEET